MLYIGSDYAGFDLKTKLVTYLKKQLKLKVEDLGAFEKTEDDFVDYAVPVAKAVAKNEANRGILICDSGHGMNIAANKIKGIRASETDFIPLERRIRRMKKIAKLEK
ncbi:MAG: Sugar-phosphate isomerase, RpiB/LacA/LacB family [Candidatus Magasanikbacteria bacterium GW2011_GWA2_37_8]|uniref:Sugar-phosphate isomerase, RpiB/LacA/LacB family n=1 Tax=Candidatus Magasanikbacteria bacterium GW2011_GWA2_37_8 TaxID=1619036 RepID=A0A0G0JW90_9BACT|nr:MAG: Sugar-phosphate isomerase, RpiB/LacA/LacB family [Candidatus Magasanikbacteria bacterium GW2011_GWA2_37_8]